MDIKHYTAQLTNLLPLGLAWPRQPGLTRDTYLEAEAAELTRVDGRVGDMLRESDPRQALETLGDWERVAGLPDSCVVASSITIQERRQRLVQKLVSTGGQSVGYFTDIAENMGYPIILKEFRPFVCGWSECGLVEEDSPTGSVIVYGLTDIPEIRYYWRIEVLEPRVTWFRVSQSELGKDPLAKIDFATDLECVINKLKPAHTELVFSYEG